MTASEKSKKHLAARLYDIIIQNPNHFGGNMDIQSTLSGIKQRDKEAFRALVREYGRGLYIKLYASSGNAEAAREATKAAFTELYLALNSQQGPDVLESLLYSLGEKKQQELLREQAMKLTAECFNGSVKLPVADKRDTVNAAAVMVEHNAEPETQSHQDIPVVIQHQTSGAGTSVFWKVVLILLGVAVVWLGLGLLMGAGHLPQYDLGYSWFNLNIARWFTWL